MELWAGVTTTAVQQEHEAIKRDLEHLGIRVELFTAENWKQYKIAVLGKRPGAMYRTSWFADFPDPDNFLFPCSIHRAPIIMPIIAIRRSISSWHRHAARVIISNAFSYIARSKRASWRMLR